MGINGIGNPYSQSGVYETVGMRKPDEEKGNGVNGNRFTNMVVTEARERVSFAVATPQLADALNLTADERQEYLASVEEKAASATVNLGNKSVMLDIYALTELIREMGQKLRNAMRDMRQCENAAIQQNIKTQAAMQRSTAYLQMLGSLAVGGLQATISTWGSVKQLKGLSHQNEQAKMLGANMAEKHLEMAEVGGHADLAKAQLDKVKAKMPKGIVDTSKDLLQVPDRPTPPKEVLQAREKISTLQNEIAEMQKIKGDFEDQLTSGSSLTLEQWKSCKNDLDKIDRFFKPENEAVGSAADKALTKIYDSRLTGAKTNYLETQIKDLDLQIEAKFDELNGAVNTYNELTGVGADVADGMKNAFSEKINGEKALLAEAIKANEGSSGKALPAEADKAKKGLSEKVRNAVEASKPDGPDGWKGCIWGIDRNAHHVRTCNLAGEIIAGKTEIAEARAQLNKAFSEGQLVLDYNDTPNGNSLEWQKTTHDALVAEVNKYKQHYEDVLKQVNGEERLKGGASNDAKAALIKAECEYTLARAEQLYKSSLLDKLPQSEFINLEGSLKSDLAALNESMRGGADFRAAEASAQYGRIMTDLSNSLIGGVVQKIVDGIAQVMQSGITEKQADQKMLEEQLDQIKDAFVQTQAVIQKATELFQSVVSKESQSTEEIISALRA